MSVPADDRLLRQALGRQALRPPWSSPDGCRNPHPEHESPTTLQLGWYMLVHNGHIETARSSKTR